MGDYPAVCIDPCVNGRLSAAGTDRLYLRDGVGKLHEPPCAGEKVGEKVRSQTEAKHGNVLTVDKLTELIYLLRREKLRFVGNDDAAGADLAILLQNVLLRRYYLSGALKPDAAADDVRTVSRVGAGLYEPHRHTKLLVVELGDERLSRFRRTHCAVLEIKLCHIRFLILKDAPAPVR